MPPFAALVDYEDAYVQPLILKALEKRCSPDTYTLVNDTISQDTQRGHILQFRAYEAIDFESALRSQDSLVNAYIIRKALIRKHYLSNTVHTWTTKHPDSVLSKHVKPAVAFEVDYAEFLDDALIEAYELNASFAKNEELEPEMREWWILKPSMTDKGQGIRLFSTEAELTSIFEEWDPPDSDEEDDAKSQNNSDTDCKSTGHDEDSQIPTSQLRDFIAQPYISRPLLLPAHDNRKFHIRTYVLAIGALKVYVYKPMLALFAPQTYAAPWESIDLKTHLTNTCLQSTGEREGAVHAFWDLPSTVPGMQHVQEWREDVYSQICNITGELFRAAVQNNAIHFQPLPNAFELFGLDYLVDADGTAWLLEVNAFPDFKQTGEDLQEIVAGLFEEVVQLAIKPFFGIVDKCSADIERSTLVLDLDVGRR